jgi:glycosyltransferase involved in cell wall biosynthesis
MFDSTAADKPRRRWREAVKRAALAPYDAALVSGPTSRAYLDSLGFKGRPVALGYDTLGTARLRAEAGGAPAPRGHAEADRVFLIVARCVPEKNIAGALDAYAHYAARARGEGRTPRPLWICGDGPLRGALEARAAALQLRGCRFLGFRAPAEVAGLLGRALALLLPSHSEPWGLVVNEALALGVPVVASTRAGAARDLLRHDLAGWALAPDDTAAWAEAMRRLDGDPALWRRLATGARDNAAAGDVARFAEGAAALLEHRT